MPQTEKTIHVLLALRDEPIHGYSIRQRVLEVTEGSVALDPGGLYRLIARLEREGLVESVDQPDHIASNDTRRVYYTLTAAGRDVLREEATRLARLVAHPAFRAALQQ